MDEIRNNEQPLTDEEFIPKNFLLTTEENNDDQFTNINPVRDKVDKKPAGSTINENDNSSQAEDEKIELVAAE